MIEVGRISLASVFPVGIDVAKFRRLVLQPNVVQRIKELRDKFADKWILMSRDWHVRLTCRIKCHTAGLC